MTQGFAIDNVTISIDKETALVPREPIVTVTGEDLIGLRVGAHSEVLLWIEKSAVVDLIGAIVAASRIEPRETTNGQSSEVQTVPEAIPEVAPFGADEIPF